MKKISSSKRGILFISALTVSVVVMMLIGSALLLLPSGRLMSSTIDEDMAANSAAVAGVQYAKAQLQANRNWRGGADHSKVIVDIPGELWIKEDHGNVIGLVWANKDESRPSMFRIRFNYQNADKEPDEGLSDPSHPMWIDSSHVSINNLSSTGAEKLYLGDGPKNSVTKSSGDFGSAPLNAATIYCEGMSGQALGAVTPQNLILDKKQKLTRNLLEVSIGFDASTYGDAVLYGGSRVKIDAKDKVLVSSVSKNQTKPRIRTLENIEVKGIEQAKFSMEGGEAFVYNKKDPTSAPWFKILGTDSTNPAAKIKDSSNSFVKLGWKDLNPPDLNAAALGNPLPAGMEKLEAGTYVWRNTADGYQLDYYASDYNNVVPTGTPNKANISAQDLKAIGITIGSNNLELKLTKNLGVVPNASAKGLAIVADDKIIKDNGVRPRTTLTPSTVGGTPPQIFSEGSIKLTGTLEGKGSIVSSDSIEVQGTSIIEANPKEMVALFAKKDIAIKAIPASVAEKIAENNTLPLNPSSFSSQGGTVSGSQESNPSGPPTPPIFKDEPPTFPVSASDVAILGVVYAQGNVTIDLHSDNVSEYGKHQDDTSRGNLYLKGMMLAYGGDYEPEAGKRGQPGTNDNSGKINLKVNAAQFEYDSSYLEQLRNQDSGLLLNILSWRSI